MADAKSVQNAGNASWFALLLPVGFRMLNQDDSHDQGAVISAWISVAFSVVCYLAGVGAGAYALVHARAVGSKSVVVPTVISTALCLFALAATALMLTGVVRL